jgi:hypothetical protein
MDKKKRRRTKTLKEDKLAQDLMSGKVKIQEKQQVVKEADEKSLAKPYLEDIQEALEDAMMTFDTELGDALSPGADQRFIADVVKIIKSLYSKSAWVNVIK